MRVVGQGIDQTVERRAVFAGRCEVARQRESRAPVLLITPNESLAEIDEPLRRAEGMVGALESLEGEERLFRHGVDQALPRLDRASSRFSSASA